MPKATETLGGACRRPMTQEEVWRLLAENQDLLGRRDLHGAKLLAGEVSGKSKEAFWAPWRGAVHERSQDAWFRSGFPLAGAATWFSAGWHGAAISIEATLRTARCEPLALAEMVEQWLLTTSMAATPDLALRWSFWERDDKLATLLSRASSPWTFQGVRPRPDGESDLTWVRK